MAPISNYYKNLSILVGFTKEEVFLTTFSNSSRLGGMSARIQDVNSQFLFFVNVYSLSTRLD